MAYALNQSIILHVTSGNQPVPLDIIYCTIRGRPAIKIVTAFQPLCFVKIGMHVVDKYNIVIKSW